MEQRKIRVIHYGLGPIGLAELIDRGMGRG